VSLERTVSILVVSAKQTYREQLALDLSGGTFEVTTCKEMAAAQSLLMHQEFDLIFCEDVVPENLRRLARNPIRSACSAPIVVVSSQNDWGSYLEVLRSGAFDRLVLPAARSELHRLIYAALRESAQALNERTPFTNVHSDGRHTSFQPVNLR
jgi:DNA-binding response OmpR family regulator